MIMRLIYCLLISLLWTVTTFAQGPSNDNCETALNLGNLPACTDQVFSNIDADETILGNQDIPSCFNGGTTQRDVWFSFTTPADVSNVIITVTGVENGPNAQALINPQFAVYQGNCSDLAELTGFCARAPNGAQSIQLAFAGLEPNASYFLRVNDYSPTASPNSGDFTICIEEGDIPVNMGEAEGSTACRGTLYDTGGPDGPYTDLENSSFTICPDQPGCIEIEVLEFAIENFIPGGIPGLNGDQLLFFAGEGTDGPLLARVSGFSGGGEPIRVQTDESCITVVFASDFFSSFDGFELQWRCLPECNASSAANPTAITSVPFSGDFSTCEDASTLADSPCSGDVFLNGPEFVFTFESSGNLCADVALSNAAEGTGIVILNGPPDVDESICIARSSRGVIPQANFQEAGTYYILVGNSGQCTDFTLSITSAECSISPSLQDALCNPLNGCIDEDGIPSVFLFEDGFQDIDITDANRGCWEGFGDEPDFVWFTIQSAADGPFGFMLQSGDNISDIDFNVWGPFTPDQVCESANEVISFISNNPPIRSSYAPSEGGITGIADRHPEFGISITDDYDCGNIVGSGGDDFVRTIPTKKGEVYVVLMNDWGNEIESGGILIDWSPSAPQVLGPIIPEVISDLDTALCLGDSIQIQLEGGIDAIQWLNATETLSCTDCLNPVATPTQTTTYQALIDAVCYKDTVSVTVNVLELDLGEDISVCRNAEFAIEAGPEFSNASYEWTASDGITLSCTDCASPTVTTSDPGDYTLTATLNGSNCTLTDDIVVTVLDNEAPAYSISDDLQICLGDSVFIGGATEDGVSYFWSSQPVGLSSEESNPQVKPTGRTTYFLQVSNADCPLPTLDSVTVDVSLPPQLKLVSDTAACQGDSLVLGLSPVEEGVSYTWTGPGGTTPDSAPNAPQGMSAGGTQTFTLQAEQGACLVEESVQVDITEIAVEISGMDSLLLCKGDTEQISVQFAPASATVQWTPDVGIELLEGNIYTVNPSVGGLFTAEVSNGNCVRFDSIYIAVDSLPADMMIMPQDTTICEGETVILTSTIYEPADFKDIEFEWFPSAGQQTPDSLYNLVVTPDTTYEYFRVNMNGACRDTSFTTVNVNKISQISVIPGDTTVCQGEQVNLMLQIPEGKQIEEIMWTPEAGLSCTDCENPVVTAGSTTAYNVEGKIDDCPVSAGTFINVIPGPRVSLIGNTAICIGQSIQLNVAADAFTTYEWSSPDDPDFSSTDPLLEVSPAQTTTYRLVAKRGECDDFEGEVVISVIQKATISFDAPTEICSGDALTLSAQSNLTEVGENFIWLYDGKQVNGENVVLNDVDETTSITLRYENPCETIEEVFTVNVKESVRIIGINDITSDTIDYLMEGVPLGRDITLSVETDPEVPSGATFEWFANDELIPGNGSTVTHTPVDNPTIYRVDITRDGCVSTANVSVEVIIPRFDVPNAFTPNGDNRNDFFNVVGTPGAVYEMVEFKVWNRWGQLVYNNENPTQGWDGNQNGNPAASDIYIYKITLRLPNGQDFNFDGDVALLR